MNYSNFTTIQFENKIIDTCITKTNLVGCINESIEKASVKISEYSKKKENITKTFEDNSKIIKDELTKKLDESNLLKQLNTEYKDKIASTTVLRNRLAALNNYNPSIQDSINLKVSQFTSGLTSGKQRVVIDSSVILTIRILKREYEDLQKDIENHPTLLVDQLADLSSDSLKSRIRHLAKLLDTLSKDVNITYEAAIEAVGIRDFNALKISINPAYFNQWKNNLESEIVKQITLNEVVATLNDSLNTLTDRRKRELSEVEKSRKNYQELKDNENNLIEKVNRLLFADTLNKRRYFIFIPEELAKESILRNSKLFFTHLLGGSFYVRNRLPFSQSDVFGNSKVYQDSLYLKDYVKGKILYYYEPYNINTEEIKQRYTNLKWEIYAPGTDNWKSQYTHRVSKLIKEQVYDPLASNNPVKDNSYALHERKDHRGKSYYWLEINKVFFEELQFLNFFFSRRQYVKLL